MAQEYYSRAGDSGPIVAQGGKLLAVDLPSAGAAAVTLATIAVPGIELGDIIILTPPAGGLSVAVGLLPGYCSVAGTAKVPIVNPTAAPLDAAAADLDYLIFKKPSNAG